MTSTLKTEKLQFRGDNSDAITLSSSGGVTVGGAFTSAGDLTVSRNEANGTVRLNLSNTGVNGSTEYSELKLNSTAGGTQTSVVQHRNNYGLNVGTTTNHAVYLLQNNANALSIDTSKNVTVNSGNLVIGTSGKGIDFSATANTSATGASTVSELFDDYEEGTWTPTISSSGGSGVVTTHNGGATYTKVGRDVRVTFQCVLNTKGSGTGYMYIQGLPYVTGSGSTHYGFAFGYFSGTNNEQRGGWASASTSFIRFNRGANMDGQVMLSDLTNGYYLSGSFFYYTDS